jgi:hypothetical protein
MDWYQSLSSQVNGGVFPIVSLRRSGSTWSAALRSYKDRQFSSQTLTPYDLYLVVGTVLFPCFTSVGFGAAGPLVNTGDGGDALSGLVGMVVGERHVD